MKKHLTDWIGDVQNFEKFYRSFVDYIPLLKQQFCANIYLAVLGGRTCYHPDFDDIDMSEKYYTSEEETIKIVTKFFTMKHFSVFSHIPLRIEKSFYGGYTNMAGVWEDEHFYYFNGRHVVETLFYYGNSLKEYIGNSPLRLSNTYYVLKDEKFNIRVCYFDLDFAKSIIYTGISRCATHQFVRHTTLGFSQQSQRYARLTPENFYNEKIIYQNLLERGNEWFYQEKIDAMNSSAKVYLSAIKRGVANECARGILPAETKSKIMCTAHNSLHGMMLKTRIEPSAQVEIRLFSNLVNSIR